MTLGGLVPTSVSALGIVFEPADQQRLLRLLGLIVLYLVVVFVLRAVVDWSRWRIVAISGLERHGWEKVLGTGATLLSLEQLRLLDSSDLKPSMDGVKKQVLRHRKWTRWLLRAWASAEFLAPVAVGLWALLSLFTWSAV